jgi:hypothetical protein
MKNEYFSTTAASLRQWKTFKCKILMVPAPVRGQVQILACVRCANIIQCQSNMCQEKIFLFEARSQVLYNIYID